jgi:hypothetical protein
MKKLITLLLLFTLVGFLSGNQVVITNDYEYLITTEATYNFTDGDESNNVKYDRTNKIAIQNNKVLADILKYHYAFFWDEADSFIGYYKTNKGITTSGAYLGEVNTQSIPLPLNAYSFALVRYDNDYVLVGDYTIEDLFIDNNLDYENLPDFNEIPIPELNGLTLNEVFANTLIPNADFSSGLTGWTKNASIGTVTTTNNVTSLEIIGTTPALYTSSPLSLTNGQKIYWLSTMRSNSMTAANFRLELRSPTAFGTLRHNLAFLPTDNVYRTFSNIIDITLTDNYTLHFRGDTFTIGDNFEILNGLKFINLTALGLTSVSKTALDFYYQAYLNPINWIYYATDGNVSTVDGYYYASGKNLFDKEAATNNRLIDLGNGTLSTNTNFFTSDFISVSESTQYVFSHWRGTAGTGLVYFDSNKTYISGVSLTTITSAKTFTTPSNAAFIRLTMYYDNLVITNVIDVFQIELGSTPTTFEAFATPTTTLNLTFLFGVGNEPNKATMDGYYTAYEEYLDYSFILPLAFNGQTISFETIYFDDGVSTEIEKLGSILIFTLIGFTLMIFGFASKRRIFNLLSIGAFIVLGVLLAEFAGFLIIVFGLVVLNLYYTFLGDI